MEAQTITKKAFKELCDFHVYTGHRVKHNVIFFDWQETEKGRGFKYAVALDIKLGNKAELFEALYNWIFKSVNLPYYVRYKYAETDAQRIKPPLGLNW